MSILNRLKKLETNNLNKPQCFCNKTLIDLWYGKSSADALTYCPKCKERFDYWAILAAQANRSDNLTDNVKGNEVNEFQKQD